MTNSELTNIATQYARLDQMKKDLEKRLEQLSKVLKSELTEGKHEFGDYELTIQLKDRTTIDEEAVRALPGEAFDACVETVVQVNEQYVEQAYLNGILTDSDLRAIRKPQYSVALIARKKEENVQADS